MRVFLTGATGLIGVPLVARLCERGDQAIVLSRRPEQARSILPGAEIVEGNPQQTGDWMKSIDGCDAVVNLAGEPVFGRRWNDAVKQELRDSRIVSTRRIVEAIGTAAHRPQALVNASAIGFYGDVPEGELTEKSAAGSDFLAGLCIDWEAAAWEARHYNVRVAAVRVGVVLARHGGALAKMITPFRLGLGGPVGSGRQWVSWIHLDDMVSVFLLALDHPEASGPINGTAPEPLRNKAFSRCLAESLRRPCLFPVPGFALWLRFGEVAEVITGGQRVLPARLEQLGFQFRLPTCAVAMADLFAR